LLKLKIDFSDGSRGSRKLNKWDRASKANLVKGLRKVGSLMLGSYKDKISGLGFVRDPGTSRKYYGILSGDTIKTSRWKLIDGNMGVRIGPHTDYTHYPEKKRPALGDTFKENKEAAIEIIEKYVFKGL